MASPCAALAGGDSTLVRDFQPLNWSNDRTPRRLVCHLVDDLGNQQDVVMPETDGGEVAARVKADPELHNTSIVFLTALVTRAEAKSGLHIQGHPFLAKPVSIPELINAIEQHLPVCLASRVSL
jgi:response regulator RpfG family c-di-GMP phosphodiesterase